MPTKMAAHAFDLAIRTADTAFIAIADNQIAAGEDPHRKSRAVQQLVYSMIAKGLGKECGGVNVQRRLATSEINPPLLPSFFTHAVRPSVSPQRGDRVICCASERRKSSSISAPSATFAADSSAPRDLGRLLPQIVQGRLEFSRPGRLLIQSPPQFALNLCSVCQETIPLQDLLHKFLAPGDLLIYLTAQVL
jgi:hypothetical protein